MTTSNYTWIKPNNTDQASGPQNKGGDEPPRWRPSRELYGDIYSITFSNKKKIEIWKGNLSIKIWSSYKIRQIN